MTIISILGSCRQENIRNNYEMTDLHNLLTYPHYSSEVLQEILYIKSGCKMIPDEVKYVMRNSLLDIKLDKKRIVENYEKTDVFLVEIASRKIYKKGGYFCHHIVEDKYQDVEIREQTDEEIENDIIEIRKELYPKKFIIIPHIYTRKNSKRYELVKLLETICGKFSIPFIDCSILQNSYSEDVLYEKEKVLVHYTPIGHQIVSELYKRKIEELKEDKLCQIYYTSEERMRKYTFHGFGDYLRGTCYLHQKFGDNLGVSFSHHNMNKYLCSPKYRTIEECENATYFFGNDSPDLNKLTNVFTNAICAEPISEETKKFILKNCLEPRIGFASKIAKLKQQFGHYNVIHIRMDDNNFLNTNLPEDKLKKIEFFISQVNPKTCLLMTSSDILQSYLVNKYSFLQYEGPRGHIGKDQGTETALTEFFLLMSAKSILQLSSYSWGSGFSHYAAILGNVPLIRYQI